VSERVVNSFEQIEIYEHHRQLFVIAPGERDGLVNAVIQQQAIGQIGEKIVLGLMGEFEGLDSRCTQIVKDGNHAGDVSVTVADPGGTTFYL
jgi:hypothetical protein